MTIRFSYPKEEKKCFECKGMILKGDACIQAIYFSKKRQKDSSVFYHKDCYNNHQRDYVNSWFLQHPHQKVRLGRKVKRTSPMIGTRYGKSVQTEVHKERRRLMALYRYHRKAGNTLRMEELVKEIQQVSCGVNPYMI